MKKGSLGTSFKNPFATIASGSSEESDAPRLSSGGAYSGGLAGEQGGSDISSSGPVGSPVMEATRASLETGALLKGRSPWMSESSSLEEQRRHAAHSASFQSSCGYQTPHSDDDEYEGLLGRRNRRGASMASVDTGDNESDEMYTPRETDFDNIPAIDLDFSEMPRLSTFRQSTVNCINLLMGIGLLSYPYVLKLAGWVPGITAIVLMAMICNYTGKLIAEIMEYQPSFKLREGSGAYTIIGFHDLGRVAFGTAGSLFVSAAFLGETFGYGCIYLIVEGDNLHKLLSGQEHFKHFTQHDFMLISLFIFLPTLLLRNLSILSYFSALGALSAGLLWAGVMISGVDGAEPNPAYCKGECTGSVLDPSPTELARWTDITAVIGLAMVGLSGHAVFPTLRNDMVDRRLYPYVLDISYTVILVIYLSIATFGYLMFGSACQEEITLNLGYSFVSQLAVWVVCINPISKFALDMAPICLGIESMIFAQLNWRVDDTRPLPVLISILTRTAIAFCALFVVYSIPSFSVMMGIMGSICSFTIAVTFPCACYLRLKWFEISFFKRALNVFLIILGLFASISGAIAAAMGDSRKINP